MTKRKKSSSKLLTFLLKSQTVDDISLCNVKHVVEFQDIHL